jgi:hypothetical protein
MTKFLLCALAVALLGGNARADGVAGDVPLKPEPDIVSKAVETVTWAFCRAKCVVLASLVRPGMDLDQAHEILGRPNCVVVGRGNGWTDCYFRLGLSVNFSRRVGAGGGPEYCVTGVRIWPLAR